MDCSGLSNQGPAAHFCFHPADSAKILWIKSAIQYLSIVVQSEQGRLNIVAEFPAPALATHRLSLEQER
jgi:hypothetical protein